MSLLRVFRREGGDGRIVASAEEAGEEAAVDGGGAL